MKNLDLTKTIAILFIVSAFVLSVSAQMPAAREETFINRALELIKNKDFANAEKAAREAIKINSKSGEGYALLGVALGMTGREAEAEAALEKSIQYLSPDSPWLKQIREIVTKLNGETEENAANEEDPEEKAEDTNAVKTKVPPVSGTSPQAGLWKAKITNVEREETITFRVSANGRQLEDVVFGGYWRCDDAMSSFRKGLLKKVDVNSPPGTFAVADGAFSDIKKEPYLAWTFEGVFTSATTAKGTFRIEYATECDTYKLEWTARRVSN